MRPYLAEPVGAERPGTYVPALDGLRGVAVSAVVLFHALWLPGGWAGVDIFFVLSGFLITSNLRREARSEAGIDLRRFYIRRILRLTPALWALFIAVLLLAPFRAHPVNTLRAVALAFTYLMNWSRAFGWFPDDLLDHTWSLAMEEQFYLIWPLLFALLLRHRPLVWLTAAFAAVTAWRLFLAWQGAGYERLYSAFDTHADGLMLGAIAALVDWRPAALRTARRFALVPIVILAGAFALLRIDSTLAQSAGLSVTAAASAWLVLAAGAPGWLAGLLSWTPLVWLGRISYGLYLWHFPVFILLRSKVSGPAVFSLIALSLALALFSFFVIERPFLRLKARFEPAATRRPILAPEARTA